MGAGDGRRERTGAVDRRQERGRSTPMAAVDEGLAMEWQGAGRAVSQDAQFAGGGVAGRWDVGSEMSEQSSIGTIDSKYAASLQPERHRARQIGQGVTQHTDLASQEQEIWNALTDEEKAVALAMFQQMAIDAETPTTFGV